jgi:mRNA-degrading endonuclease toxin of MazEF toxin-antitoxin module
MNKKLVFPQGFPHRGEIYQVSFKKTGKGKEISKERTALVVSNNTQNQYDDYLIVAPLTSRNMANIRLFEYLVKNDGLTKPSKILLNQIRSIDKNERLIEYLGKVEEIVIKEVEKRLKLVLALE